MTSQFVQEERGHFPIRVMPGRELSHFWLSDGVNL